MDQVARELKKTNLKIIGKEKYRAEVYNMCNEEKSCVKRAISVCSKILLLAGVVVVFYKLPTIIADKISYWELKNKKIPQNYGED